MRFDWISALVVYVVCLTIAIAVALWVAERRLQRLEVIIDGVFSGGNKVEPK